MTKLWLILAVLLYALMIVLALRPAFDLDAARVFYSGDGHFVGATRVGTLLRYTFWVFPYALYVAMIVALRRHDRRGDPRQIRTYLEAVGSEGR